MCCLDFYFVQGDLKIINSRCLGFGMFHHPARTVGSNRGPPAAKAVKKSTCFYRFEWSPCMYSIIHTLLPHSPSKQSTKLRDRRLGVYEERKLTHSSQCDPSNSSPPASHHFKLRFS